MNNNFDPDRLPAGPNTPLSTPPRPTLSARIVQWTLTAAFVAVVVLGVVVLAKLVLS